MHPVSKGHAVLPKSVTPSRIEDNLKTVKLDSSDIEALDAIHKKKGITRFVYPAFGVSTGGDRAYMCYTDLLPGCARLPRQGVRVAHVSFVDRMSRLAHSVGYDNIDRNGIWPSLVSIVVDSSSVALWVLAHGRRCSP